MASDNDYYPIQNQQLTIPLTTSVDGEVCASIIIIGDDIMEPNELFQVLITAVNANDAVPAVFRITIADDGDGMVKDFNLVPSQCNNKSLHQSYS